MPSLSVLALLAAALIAAAHGTQAQEIRATLPIIVAEGGAHSDPQAAPAKVATTDDEENLSPEEKMRRRFPQPVRVGDLIGLPVLDWDDSTLGYVRHVVRMPEGKDPAHRQSRPVVRIGRASGAGADRGRGHSGAADRPA